MKKNNGFTLIELLAVIVILAIIALIATPQIMGVIETARQGAAKSSALGFIDAVEKQMMINELDGDTTNDIKDNDTTTPNYAVATLTGSTYGVAVKGSAPTSGTVTVTDGKVASASLVINNKYTVSYDITKSASDTGWDDNHIKVEAYSA